MANSNLKKKKVCIYDIKRVVESVPFTHPIILKFF